MTRPFLALTLALSALAVTSCGPIDAALDCGSICSRYAQCYDTSYDVGACETRCRASSTDDQNYRRQADTCNACIQNRACLPASFTCTIECAAVVP